MVQGLVKVGQGLPERQVYVQEVDGSCSSLLVVVNGNTSPKHPPKTFLSDHELSEPHTWAATHWESHPVLVTEKNKE